MPSDPFCTPFERIRRHVWLEVWTLVFAVNLFMPLLFGWSVTSHGGRIGMFLAITFLWLLGVAVCRRAGMLRTALVVGAAIFSASQVLPLIQVFSGELALTFWFKSDPTDLLNALWMNDGAFSETGGFIVTLLTAVPSVVIALGCGFVVCTLTQQWQMNRSPDPPAQSQQETA
jgi:hypothetical protein